MSGRSLRLAVAALFLAGLGFAAYQAVELDARRRQIHARLSAVDEVTGRILEGLGELRSAQQAYVAAGQGQAYWMAKADQAREGLGTALVTLKEQTTTQETATEAGAAAQSLDNFWDMDDRVREYVENGQLLMASDIIFTDGLDLLRTAGEHVQAVRLREAELAAVDQRLVRDRQILYAGGAMLGAVLVVVLFAVPELRKRSAEDQARSLSLTDSGPAGEPAAGYRPVVSELAARSSDRIQAERLGAIATVCTDLARISDAGALPPVLDRAAQVLGAKGLVIWLAGPSGESLRPVLASGYPAELLGRMGAIPRDADNATAAAYRQQRMATVPAEGEAPGALVVPLTTAAGCVGVLTAELPGGGERRLDTQAVASILAAQISGLIPDAGEPAPATEASEPPAAQAQA